MDALEYLRDNLRDDMSLADMIGEFEKMYAIPLEVEVDPDDDIILFETGVFDFDEKPQFAFSLVHIHIALFPLYSYCGSHRTRDRRMEMGNFLNPIQHNFGVVPGPFGIPHRNVDRFIKKMYEKL